MFNRIICETYQYARLERIGDDRSDVDDQYAADQPNFPKSTGHRVSLGKKRLWQLWSTILTTLCFSSVLLPALAAPQSCILCDKDDIASKDPRDNFEEFLFEHQVTRQDAINALKSMNETFYNVPSMESSCKSISCSEKVMKYCLGPQFINDHCWCELGHNNEGLPFVPHICYVGEKQHKAYVGSCFFYEEVKDCCCANALAKQWRHISGAISLLPRMSMVIAILLLLSLLVT